MIGSGNQLDCACRDSLPPLAREGIARFNAGDYYRQHDLFEELWRQTTGAVRNLYQGILQVGIAYYQITQGNRRGAIKMLRRSARWLALLPDVCQGVDVQRLRQDSTRVRLVLEQMESADLADFDRSLLQPVVMTGGNQTPC